MERADHVSFWTACAKGNGWCFAHTELADDEPYRQGIGFSRIAQTLETAIVRLQTDEKIKKVVKDEVLKPSLAVAQDLQPALAKINAGRTVKVTQELQIPHPCLSATTHLAMRACVLLASTLGLVALCFVFTAHRRSVFEGGMQNLVDMARKAAVPSAVPLGNPQQRWLLLHCCHG